MMSKNIVLIDADSLCYLGKTNDSLQQIIEKVDYKIQAILEETKADYYCLFISKGQYFRHSLKDSSEESGSYKSNRKYSNQNYNRVIKEYLIAQYNAVSSSLVEADDLIAYWMNKSIYWSQELDPNSSEPYWMLTTYKNENSEYKSYEANKILAAVDKDLLQSIPGKHLNYSKKLGADEWGMEWVETSEVSSRGFRQGQMIIGDASDGVIGLPGKGEKYWEKMCLNGEVGYVNIAEKYMIHYGISKGIYEFQKNYRLLHLLDCDEDFMREVGYIPGFPIFQRVERIKESEIKSEF